jgi:ABC-2 type transport system permease protein
MSEVFIVLRREFLERVRSKAFVIGTFLFPVFIIAIYALPVLMGGSKSVTRLVVVDEAPAGVAQTTTRALQAPRADGAASGYTVEVVRQPLEQVRADLTRRVAAKELDGYLYLPPDVVTKGAVQYRARNVANLDAVGDMRRAASLGVQEARLRATGLQSQDLAALLKPVQVSTARITSSGEEGGSAMSAFLLAYAAALLSYMMILMYGMNVMRSVLEEKTNRIAEVIVSSMRASHLMMGKIIGVASVALLQVGIWTVLVSFGTAQLGARAPQGGTMQKALDSLKVNPGAGLAVLAFFVLGFFLYASMFAALGAAVNSEQEAQQSQTWVMLPLIVPLVFLMKIAGDPLGQTATVLGMIPFTAPVTNAMRLGTGAEIPPVQLFGSLALLAATTVFMAWAAGKIYRVGILSTGKKPTLRELGRWLRAA